MNVVRLWDEGRPHFACRDWLRKIIGRRGSQGLIDIRKMFAVKLVEIAVVGGVVLRSVPPVPIAALGDQDFFKGQLPLRFGGASRVLRIKFAGVVEVVPGTVVLGSADP